MPVRIRVKLGEVEIECEGSEEFVKTELLDLARELVRLGGEGLSASIDDVGASSVAGRGPAQQRAFDPGAAAPAAAASEATPAVHSGLSISEVADKLGAKSGSDLLVAAAAYRAFVLGSPTFDRGELLETMRQAPDHYKRSYTNNLSGYISTLVKREVFVEMVTDIYALASATQAELASQLRA